MQAYSSEPDTRLLSRQDKKPKDWIRLFPLNALIWISYSGEKRRREGVLYLHLNSVCAYLKSAVPLFRVYGIMFNTLTPRPSWGGALQISRRACPDGHNLLNKIHYAVTVGSSTTS
jgi:hypothetical protein